ncbi:hypothetical protein HII36_18560 [Nonomuraea sp. NN258]|uniref:hypothetical protein n=1 Tax=Nonomuraea antri TaxID=2730852 RepID=UPI0015698455|nr:hypothetical protein [Nonomuraea antri]NRQ33839.1 hypothetical protein [Nonomuraea antri]
MSNFEERLLSALKEDISRRTMEGGMVVEAPVRSRGRRVAGLGAAVAGVAAATVAAVAVFGGFAAPAFAVTKAADGGVEVTINDYSDPEGLERALAAQGIKAAVDYLPAGQTCQDGRGTPAKSSSGRTTTTSIGSNDGEGVRFRIEPGQVTADQTLVLALSADLSDSRPPVSARMEVVEGAVADCVPTALNLPPAGPGQETGDGPSTNEVTGEDDRGGTHSAGG